MKYISFATSLLLILSGCVVNQNIRKGAEPFSIVDVFFATDRKTVGFGREGDRFGEERGTLKYGFAQVSIPATHRIGELESPSIYRLEFLKDPRKHVIVRTVTIIPKKHALKFLSSRIKRFKGKNTFIFVHGYLTTFVDAARRTAQMAYDLEFKGVPIFYSWPSQGKATAYTVDEQNIEWTQYNLRKFLETIFSESGADNIYLVAHSMGNRAVTKVVTSLLKVRPEFRPRLKEIILAAPDIDAEVFKRDIVPALLSMGAPVTLYASSEDKALLLSKTVHGYPRAGDSGKGLVVIRGMETIDATGVDTGFVNHSYYAESRSVLSDMYYLINEGHRADERFGLRAVDSQHGRYWIFKR